MPDALRDQLDQSEPPPSLNTAQQALWWLKKGGLKPGPEWEKAHAMCQKKSGDKACDWVHALCHWIDGDLGNAEYWRRRIGEAQATPSPAEEWDYIAERV